MKTGIRIASVSLTVALLAAFWMPNASAYDRYNDGCQSCHGAFTDGTSPKGTVFPSDDKHSMHRSDMNADCDLCHTSGDGRDPFMGSSDGTSNNAGVGCTGCHGREEDAGNDGVSPGRGAGLRQHHTNAGVSGCSNCHSDASPSNYTPVGEDVVPQYYGTADSNANEPCNLVVQSEFNENWTIGDFEGTDNDGDGQYDVNDPDCAANQAPTSDPNGPYNGTVGVSVSFDGSGSSDPESGVLTYAWDFGDGGTGAGETTTWTYSLAQDFTVTLTVTDDGSLTDTATTTATITEVPNVAPTADPNGPYTGTVGAAVTFNGSGSSDSDGTIASYAWTFGDGSSGSGVSPSHTYATADTFTVTLTVTDNDGEPSAPATTTATIADVPNVAPTADPNGPYTGTLGETVTFDGSGSSDSDGTIASYAWTFGDGSTGTGVSPSHTYATADSYTVTLMVTDNDGEPSAPATTTATISDVPNEAPTANANGPYNGAVGESVSFSSAGSTDADGTIASYLWDFGDGGSSTAANPTHTYASASTFSVTLTVTDDGGLTGSDSTTATISDVPNEAPTANANGPYNGAVGESVSFSSAGSTDADGTIASYLWDFGDGGSSTAANPTHTYASASTFSVTLTVTDDGGLTGSDSTTATISDVPNEAPTANANGPYNGAVGESVSFSSAGSTDADGTIASYLWDFGDGGSSTAANPTHTYASASTFSVTLTVTDDGGLTGSDSTTATIADVPNEAPTANANGPYNGAVGESVSFSSAGSTDADGTIASYLWDFGDGGSSTAANPTHTYASASTFSVTLTVTDDGGLTGSDSTTATISDVPNEAPTANANGPYNGAVGESVSFSSAGSTDADGTIASYLWDFGDGGSSTAANPTHTYASASTFSVTLTVTDDGGLTGSDSTTATIGAIVVDTDSDGVLDQFDFCPDTRIPEDVPWNDIKPNHYALMNNDLVFDTRPLDARKFGGRRNGNSADKSVVETTVNARGVSFTTSDTGGCSCSQIIEARGLGSGLSKYGCSAGIMRSWTASISDSEATVASAYSGNANMSSFVGSSQNADDSEETPMPLTAGQDPAVQQSLSKRLNPRSNPRGRTAVEH